MSKGHLSLQIRDDGTKIFHSPLIHGLLPELEDVPNAPLVIVADVYITRTIKNTDDGVVAVSISGILSIENAVERHRLWSLLTGIKQN